MDQVDLSTFSYSRRARLRRFQSLIHLNFPDAFAHRSISDGDKETSSRQVAALAAPVAPSNAIEVTASIVSVVLLMIASSETRRNDCSARGTCDGPSRLHLTSSHEQRQRQAGSCAPTAVTRLLTASASCANRADLMRRGQDDGSLLLGGPRALRAVCYSPSRSTGRQHVAA
jgi:hypothetical protein